MILTDNKMRAWLDKQAHESAYNFDPYMSRNYRPPATAPSIGQQFRDRLIATLTVILRQKQGEG